MRALECPAGDGDHVHAENDQKLARAVLTHAREAHPELGFNENSAERLVSEASYDDSKHSGAKESWSDFVGRTGTQT